jgi:hypothetical protein
MLVHALEPMLEDFSSCRRLAGLGLSVVYSLKTN